jgi:phosphatidylserine/phosphatidylglycerophosphate/cardiolipin synthase-like enzyme
MSTLRRFSNPLSLTACDTNFLAGARNSIDFAAYTLTEPLIIATLAAAAQRGVAIRLYLDRSEVEAEARHDATGSHLPIHPLLTQAGIQVLVKRSLILMHLKAYCIDHTTLRTGSANFSPIGETQEDNELCIDTDPVSVKAFQDKFDSMWARPDNLTVAAAISLNRAAGVVPAPSVAARRADPEFPGIAVKNAAL